jgi:hypothetical protein
MALVHRSPAHHENHLVSGDVRLGGGGIELRPLDVDHAAAFHEAVLESAAELTGTVLECLILPVPRPVRRHG